MTPVLSRFSRLILVLAIALTSVTMGLARGQTRDATGVMIICTGTGVVSVRFDADGNPVGPAHICPDCALSALGAAVAVVSLQRPVLSATRIAYPGVTVAQAGRDQPPTQARDPPVA